MASATSPAARSPGSDPSPSGASIRHPRRGHSDRRLQEPALPDDDALPGSSVDPDPCKSPEQIAKMPGIVIGRTLAKLPARRAILGDCVLRHVAADRHVVGNRGEGSRAPIAKSFRVISIFEAGFEPVRLEALVYTDLYESPSVLRVRRQRHGRRDEGRRHRSGPRHREGKIDVLPRQRHLPHDGLARAQPRPLFTALLIQQIGMSFVLRLAHHPGRPPARSSRRS